LHRTASNDVLVVKIGPVSASVDTRKNWGKKCTKNLKFLGVYFGYMGVKPLGWLSPYFCWKKISQT